MKILKLFTLIFSFVTLSVTAQPGKKTIVLTADGQPNLKFETTEHDFGTIVEGTQAVWEFEYTNTGKAPLILTNVLPPCNCTVPQWSKEPLMPGKSARIIVTFDSKGKPGAFSKTIAVNHNGEAGTDYIIIKGIVGT